MFNKRFFTLLAASALIFTSCKPEETDPDPQPTNTKAELAFHFEHVFGDDKFNLNEDFTLSNGAIVNLSFVKFYMSGITLMDDDGSAQEMEDYFLVDQSTHHMEIGSFDPQHVHMVKFDLGVDSAANFLDPTTYANGHPLAPQSPSMHWSWNNGYIFFRLEGSVDTDADGTVDNTFEYHIGLLQFLRGVSGMQHRDIAAGEELEVEVQFDYELFFDGLDLNMDLSAHGMDDPVLSKKIADNAVKAVTIE